MAVIMVLMILVAAALTMSLSYTSRSISRNSRQQAYYTARSALDLLADEICSDSTQGQTMLNQLKTDGASFTIDDMGFDSSMGACSVEAVRRGNLITLTANAKSGGREYRMALDLTGTDVTTGDSNQETVDPAFESGWYFTNLNNELNKNFESWVNTDIYYTKSLTVRANQNEQMVFSRNLLCTQKLELIANNGLIHVHGMIYSDSDVYVENAYVGVGDDHTQRFPTCSGEVETSGIYTTGDVTITGASAVVNGNITARNVTISNGATVNGKIQVTGKLVITGGTHTPANAVETITSIESKLPKVAPPKVERPENSNMTKLTAQMVKNSQTSPIGKQDGTDSYYYVEDFVEAPTYDLKTQGTGNIYIFLDTGNPFKVRGVPQGEARSPNVYFILSDSASLYFNTTGTENTVIYAHVVGSGNELKIGKNTFFRGSISLSKAEVQLAKDIVVEYAEPNDPGMKPDISMGDNSGDVVTRTEWKKLRYLDEND